MTTTTNTNTAAWLTTPKSHPFSIKPAPTWSPSPTEILVENHAVAINPVDGTIQSTAWWPLPYPTILGHDIAGKVAAVGSSITRFKVGDRVLGHAVAMTSKRNEDAAFQRYTLVSENLACPIPDDLPYEQAVVLPLGISTAACGLFQKDFLNLRHPTVPAANPTGDIILVWGGAGSVGSNAIQLAVAAGYEVFTTASSKSFNLVKSLGASQVFDYTSPSVMDELETALKGRTLAGAIDCIGLKDGGLEPTVEIVKRSAGMKFVATVNGSLEHDTVAVKMVFGTSLKDNEVGKAIYEDFLPRALAEKKYVVAPEPLVVGRGLEKVQEGVDLYRNGVGARKVVVLV